MANNKVLSFLNAEKELINKCNEFDKKILDLKQLFEEFGMRTTKSNTLDNSYEENIINNYKEIGEKLVQLSWLYTDIGFILKGYVVNNPLTNVPQSSEEEKKDEKAYKISFKQSKNDKSEKQETHKYKDIKEYKYFCVNDIYYTLVKESYAPFGRASLFINKSEYCKDMIWVPTDSTNTYYYLLKPVVNKLFAKGDPDICNITIDKRRIINA